MPWQTGTLGGVPASETSIPLSALAGYLRELPNWQREEEGTLSELMRHKHGSRAFVCGLPGAHVLNASLPLSVLVDEVQRVVRASMLKQSTATLGWVRNPTTTNSAVTAEGATVHSTSVVGGDPEW